MEHSTRLPLTGHGQDHLRSTASSISKQQARRVAHPRPQDQMGMQSLSKEYRPNELEAMLQEAEEHCERVNAMLLPGTAPPESNEPLQQFTASFAQAELA